MEHSLLRSAGANMVLLAGRMLLSAIFLHEGATLALNFNATAAAFERLGLELPVAVGVILLQLAAGVSVAAGLATRLGAAALGTFCIAATTISSPAARQIQPPMATICVGRPSSSPTGAAAKAPAMKTAVAVTASMIRIVFRLRIDMWVLLSSPVQICRESTRVDYAGGNGNIEGRGIAPADEGDRRCR